MQHQQSCATLFVDSRANTLCRRPLLFLLPRRPPMHTLLLYVYTTQCLPSNGRNACNARMGRSTPAHTHTRLRVTTPLGVERLSPPLRTLPGMPHAPTGTTQNRLSKLQDTRLSSAELRLRFHQSLVFCIIMSAPKPPWFYASTEE